MFSFCTCLRDEIISLHLCAALIASDMGWYRVTRLFMFTTLIYTLIKHVFCPFFPGGLFDSEQDPPMINLVIENITCTIRKWFVYTLKTVLFRCVRVYSFSTAQTRTFSSDQTCTCTNNNYNAYSSITLPIQVQLSISKYHMLLAK